jgi:hypothetical protein
MVRLFAIPIFQLRHRWCQWLLAAVAAFWLSACQLGEREMNFVEDVQLATGATIQVDRSIRGKALGEVGGPGGWEPTYMSLEITSLATVDKPPKWESVTGLLPILFDRDPTNGEWALLATFYTCEPWYQLGRPKLPYAEFRVRNGQWQRVDLSSQWLGRDANVFTGMKLSGEPKLLAIAEKKRRDSNPAISREYVKIVDHWSSGC